MPCKPSNTKVRGGGEGNFALSKAQYWQTKGPPRVLPLPRAKLYYSESKAQQRGEGIGSKTPCKAGIFVECRFRTSTDRSPRCTLWLGPVWATTDEVSPRSETGRLQKLNSPNLGSPRPFSLVTQRYESSQSSEIAEIA